MWIVRSPDPIVSVDDESALVTPLPCTGKSDLPLGVPFEDSSLKSYTVPNGTG